MPATLTGELAILKEWVDEPTREIVAHLAKNHIPTDAESITLTDLVECDFSGYEAQRLTEWDPVSFDDELYGEVVGLAEFVADEDVAGPQAICVAYLTIKEGDNPVKLLWPIPVPKPVIIGNPGETYGFEFRISSANLDSVLDSTSEV